MLLIIANLVLIIGPLIFLAGLAGGVTSVFTNPMNAPSALGGMLVLCLAIFIVWYVFMILHGIYLKKSFDGIAQTTRTDIFKTTGLIYVIAVALLIIGIGAIIMFIANILMIVAFFSLPDQVQPMPQGGYGYGQQPPPQYGAPPQQYQQPQQQYTPPPPPPQQQAPPPQQTGRFCSSCGKPIPQDAQVCPYCGKDYRQG